MKKIFTLLLSVGAFASSFAQTGHQNNNKKNDQYVTTRSNTDYKKFDDHRDNIYTFSAKERDMQIAKINNDFNFKIKSIKSNHRIKRSQKKMWIQKIQSEKDQQIQAVNAKYNSKYNAAFNDHVKQFDKHRH
jgi:hypothetical protein